MRLIAVINLPLILLTLAVGSFALPRNSGEDPHIARSSTFLFTALVFLFNLLVDIDGNVTTIH